MEPTNVKGDRGNRTSFLAKPVPRGYLPRNSGPITGPICPFTGIHMHTVLIVIHLMIVIALVVLILLQRSEGGGLGMGGGGVQGFMTGRGQANALTRATAFLAAGFFFTSLVLSIMAGQGRTQRSIIDGAPVSAPAPGGAPAGAPIGGGQGGVLDQLRQLQQPAAPAQPGTPQVPQSQ